MKIFKEPTLEVSRFLAEDIITVSNEFELAPYDIGDELSIVPIN